jgi:hypothetical protein
MRFKTPVEVVFNLGGNGTIDGGGGTFTLPTWIYSSTPLDLTVSQSIVITPPQGS